MGKARGGKGLSIARGATVRWDTGPAAIRQYPYRTACGPAGEEAQPGPGACYATYSSSTGSRESSSLQPSNSRTRTASAGWEAPEIEYALALAVVRWELPDDACPVALFNSVLNCSSFNFFNSNFDHSSYSKNYIKYYFFCCDMFY